MRLNASKTIRIWHNKQTDAPSVEVGPITVDLGVETPAQSSLFALVMNHPDAVVQGYVIAPLTPEIAEAFEKVIAEEVHQLLPKRLAETVHFHIDRT